jgi:hypothetical protein
MWRSEHSFPDAIAWASSEFMTSYGRHARSPAIALGGRNPLKGFTVAILILYNF